MGELVIRPHTRLVTYATREVMPPSGVAVTVDDALNLFTIRNLVNPETVSVTTRLLLPDGRVQLQRETVAFAAGVGSGNASFLLAEGWLLSASVQFDVAGLARGFVFGLLSLRIGGPQGPVGLVLCSGYPSTSQPLSWPGGEVGDHLTGRGRTRVVVGTDPVAGVQISETVPVGLIWRLISWVATLVTSGVAGNRQGALLLDDGANVFHAAVQGGNITATQTITVSYAEGGQDAAEGLFVQGALPANCLLNPGFRIRTTVTGFDGGDNWSAPVMRVEEFMHP